MPDRRIALLNLAREHLGPLTESDRKLFYAVAEGREADFRSDNPEENDLDQAVTWGSDRTLKAKSIQWLCIDINAREYLSNQEIAIHGVRIEGELDLSYAAIDRPLGFIKCVFTNEIKIYQTQLRDLILLGSKVISINAAFSQIEGIVYLGEGFESQDEVNFRGASIKGQFLCTGGKFYGANSRSLSCADAKIAGNVWLNNNFEAHGTVDFSAATITGQLVCRRGYFTDAAGEALIVENATIGGGVSLDKGFSAQGKVSFAGATIGGQLICSEGLFRNPDGDALFLQGTTVTGDVDLTNGFNAQGRVSFSGAVISGQISCSGGKFCSFTSNEALSLEDAIIKGSLHLDNGFTVIGAVSCCNARVDGTLTLKDIDSSSLWSLDIRGAKIGTLNDQMKSWPPPSLLYLNGLTYTTIDTSAPLKSKERLVWLQLQPEDDFSLQPYEQLATVLKNSGHEATANEILIGKQDDRRKYGGLTRSGRVWNWFLAITIGHGYRPHRALGFSLIFLVAGTILFSIGKSQGLLSPSGVEPDKTAPASISDDYPMFSAPMYSLDAFLPIIDLHQESKWLPNANKGKDIPLLFLKVRSGQLLLWYFWVHILAGWILTTLWVAGFTGLVRNQK